MSPCHNYNIQKIWKCNNLLLLHVFPLTILFWPSFPKTHFSSSHCTGNVISTRIPLFIQDGHPFFFARTNINAILIATLALSLILTMLWMVLTGFAVNRYYGCALVAIYAVFLTTSLLDLCHVIEVPFSVIIGGWYLPRISVTRIILPTRCIHHFNPFGLYIVAEIRSVAWLKIWSWYIPLIILLPLYNSIEV